jgi:hypothetical protein
MKGLLAILGSALIGLMLVNGADGANPEPVTVGMDFVDPITITENASLRFGLLDQALNTETIIIATNDVVTGTGTGLILGGTQAAADLTVTASASQSITILVDAIFPGAGYTLTTFMCKYGSGSDTACDGSGYSETSAASATLKIGATLTGDNTAVAGNADGTFDVTVSYQ